MSPYWQSAKFWPSNVPATGDIMAALAQHTPHDLMAFLASFEVPTTVGST